MLPQFSETLLALYRGSRVWPAEEFQDRAFDLVKSVVEFDAGFWGTGAWVDGMPVMHSVHLHHLSTEEVNRDWEEIKHQDTLIAKVLQQVGTTVSFPLAALQEEPHFDRFYRKHGMARILTTYYYDSLTGLYTILSFYRGECGGDFTESERYAKQALTPHLIEACQNNRLAFVSRQGAAPSESAFASALCDEKGVLQVLDSHFKELLAEEWPSWSGPFLPEEVVRQFSVRPAVFRGRSLTMKASRMNEVLLLRARPRGALDSLGAREMEVAQAFAEGLTYKQIAQRLSMAPATARNHLNAIYQKLGIGNKAELVSLLKAQS